MYICMAIVKWRWPTDRSWRIYRKWAEMLVRITIGIALFCRNGKPLTLIVAHIRLRSSTTHTHTLLMTVALELAVTIANIINNSAWKAHERTFIHHICVFMYKWMFTNIHTYILCARHIQDISCKWFECRFWIKYGLIALHCKCYKIYH